VNVLQLTMHARFVVHLK